MKKIKRFFFISVPTIFCMLIVFELFFRVVIPAAASPDATFDKEAQIVKLDPSNQKEGTFTMGRFAEKRSKWHINNHGWNSPNDYEYQNHSGKLRACIIGDSYIEARHVNVKESVGNLLQEQCDQYQVYSFGTAGAPLSQYLHVSRYISRQYDPDVLIFLLIHNDFDQSIRAFKHNPRFLQLEVQNNTIHELMPQDPQVGNVLKKSALVRYLFFNLNISGRLERLITGNTKRIHANIDLEQHRQKAMPIQQASEYLLSTIVKENPGKRVIFVMNGTLPDIYNHSMNESRTIWLNKMVKEICARHQFEFLDLNPVFMQQYDAHQKMFNSIYDSHWDEYGHRVAAGAIGQVLKKCPAN